MFFTTVEENTLADLALKAKEACAKQAQQNLILHGKFPISEINGPFIQQFMDDAKKWQSAEVPDDLFFTHGKYIDDSIKSGRKFITEELARKPDSNRACLSLMNMHDIVESGDGPIPSFLTLQFSLSGEENSQINVTAYFRALEVDNFLPINLAEICDFLSFIKVSFPNISHFILTLISFKAYSNPKFNCLKKAEIDTLSPIDIYKVVDSGDIPVILRWLHEKQYSSETIISTEGLNSLCEAIEKSEYSYPKKFLSRVKLALEYIGRIKEIRKSTSYANEIRELEEEVIKTLDSIKKIINSQ